MIFPIFNKMLIHQKDTVHSIFVVFKYVLKRCRYTCWRIACNDEMRAENAILRTILRGCFKKKNYYEKRSTNQNGKSDSIS